MLSYSRGPDAPLIEKTIHEVFLETVERHGDRDALIVPHQSARLSWRELQAAVERTARGLAGLGISSGSRIGVWSTNCVEWVMLQLAAARVGAVLVNVNPAYRSWELRYVLRKSNMQALFLWESDHRADYRAILQEARSGEPVALQHEVYFGTESWSRMFEGGVDVAESRISFEDVANIQYTSGTTGSPKGVLLTHRNLVNNAGVCMEGFQLGPKDVVCVPVPLYHCFGCVIGSLTAVLSGAALLLPAPSFDPLAVMRAVREYRATALYGVPAMFIAQLNHPEFQGENYVSLRTGMMAGAPCPVEVMKRVVTDMHCPEMVIGYGQTESSPIITMSNVRDSLEIRVATIGAACANTEVKIVNATGDTVPVGTAGELCTRGYHVMKGYDNEAAATAKAIDDDGWLHTGDLAVMRTDEYFHITGRARDVIIRGGENIYPREVEEFLYTHPAVADVEVFGLPDERLGEIVAAWIRIRNGQALAWDELREFCRGRIAHFKIPQHVRFVEDFPTTVTGKRQKFRMRETEIEDLGLQAAARVQTA